MTAANTEPSTTAPADGASDGPHARIVLLLSSLGFFLITLDILIVNVALSSMSAELGGGTTALQWVIDGYTLMFAALLLFAGNLSDRIGAKTALGWGCALFLLASAGCAVAPETGTLIAARFVQGAAAATMLPATMALIREAYPDSRRRAGALGIWAVGGAVAGAVGPLLGGLLTTLDWRLTFGINLPVCAGMLILLRYVPPSPRRPSPFDWAGQAMALIFGLIHGGAVGFADPSVITVLGVAVAGLAGFLMVEARVKHPMMPLVLFHAQGLRIALSVGFAFMAGWFGIVFFVSLYLQQHLGLSPLDAGLVFLPALFSVTGNIMSGRTRNRFGPRAPAVAGQLSMVIGLVALLLTAPLGSPALTAALLILVGPGGAVAMPVMTGLVLDSVPQKRAGTASAIFNTFRQVGGAIAVAIFGALLANSATFVNGMQISLAIAASMLLITALISLHIRSTH